MSRMHGSHPLQSEAWGQFRSAMGIDVVRIHDGQMTFHKVPFTPFTIGYFPKGPLPTQSMMDELVRIGKQKNAIFIQLEPNVISNFKFQISNFKLLKPSYHPLFTKYTFILDLTKSEDELLRIMHPKTRYNLKVAQKHGVMIREDNSPEAFEAYLKLSQETTSRQGFFAHDETYHRRMWEILNPRGIAHLWTAALDGEILAAWIIFAWEQTLYYPYGASSRNRREVMAPTLLLWEIAKWGKRQGFQSFDLWGALGPPPAGGYDEHDPWFGFHRFKQGFYPELVEFVGSFDLIINRPLYYLYCLADRLRWTILKFFIKK